MQNFGDRRDDGIMRRIRAAADQAAALEAARLRRREEVLITCRQCLEELRKVNRLLESAFASLQAEDERAR